jgi:hypothetical protein
VAQACRNAALRVCDSAWMDKRFWSGAILVATVVVAGASALPGLLLRPASLDEPLVITAPAPKDSAPVVAKVEPVAKPVEPAPQVAQPPLAQAQPAPPAAAQVVQPAQPPQPAAVAPAVPAPAAQAAPAFPPVQPIGVATQSGPDAPPTQSRPVSAKPEGVKPEGQKAKREKTRMTLQDAKARKRPVRPAIYPLREFFAWR